MGALAIWIYGTGFLTCFVVGLWAESGDDQARHPWRWWAKTCGRCALLSIIWPLFALRVWEDR